MKKLSLIVIGLLLSSLLFSGELNGNAATLKDNFQDIYEAVKTRAIREWGTDHEMVVYEINNQSDALIETALLLDDYTEITFYALTKWSDVDLTDYDNIYVCSINWIMVVYEAKKQITAQSSY